jgi:carboxyl-terminal processing protease
MSSGVLNMLYTDDVKSVVWDYYLKNRKSLSRYKNVKEYANNFRSDEMINQYIATLEPSLRKIALKIISDTTNYNYFRLQMKAQLARVLYRSNGYYSINTTDDKMVKKAKGLLYSKDYLQIISR